jgi:hypothetical protein
MELRYDMKENLYYQTKEVLCERLASVLVNILEKTFKTNKVFNAELLVRQNFLTICETPEYSYEVFGYGDVFYYDDYVEDYLPAYKLEGEVISMVMERMNLVDLDIKNFL